MKSFGIMCLFVMMVATAGAQNKTEKIPVSGNCGMCKNNIEKAAMKAGASTATWDVDSKMLTVKYNSSTTNAAFIQQGIAAAGYDTRDVKTTDDAYHKLHACCQYEREATEKRPACCAANCDMKDGKCADAAKCKSKDCCKDEAVCKSKDCCKAAN